MSESSRSTVDLSAVTAELRVPFTLTSDSMSQKHKHIECSRAYYPSHISLAIPINHALACISTPQVSIVSEFRERDHIVLNKLDYTLNTLILYNYTTDNKSLW